MSEAFALVLVLFFIGSLLGAASFAIASYRAVDKALDFSNIEHPGDMWRLP